MNKEKVLDLINNCLAQRTKQVQRAKEDQTPPIIAFETALYEVEQMLQEIRKEVEK